MKLVIISDTHGNYPLALKALDDDGAFDGIIHLGDIVEDATVIEGVIDCPIVKLAGNCDHGSIAPLEIHRFFDGMHFFLTHGHTYGVKGGLGKLLAKAKADNVQVVLYGHTHQAAVELIEGIYFINPGSLHEKTFQKSYALMEIDNGSIKTRLVHLPTTPD